jgi:DNA processing protein
VEIKHINPRGHLYLEPLKELAHEPALLYLKGSLPANRQISVAIVGSRKPTSYGKEVTFKLAYNLAKRGVVIISGLAYGVDSIAHRGALAAGGVTIAVLPSALEQIYPAAHRRLAEEIIEKGGALISEYGSGTSPQKYQFLARNRIISGLADAVIITEAGERSGTLSTTNHALDQNKEVFAVPGNITSHLSIGPNRLIQQGAHPILSAESVLEVLAPHLLEAQAPEALGSTPAEKMLVKLIQQGIRTSDELQRQSGLSASEYASTLSLLEIQGVISFQTPNQWTLIGCN